MQISNHKCIPGFRCAELRTQAGAGKQVLNTLCPACGEFGRTLALTGFIQIRIWCTQLVSDEDGADFDESPNSRMQQLMLKITDLISDFA